MLTPTFNLNAASLVAQKVKHLPAMRETRVQSLGWEDPQEKEMATHSGTLAWKIPWTEKPGRLWSMESQSWAWSEQLHFYFHFNLNATLFIPKHVLCSRHWPNVNGFLGGRA